MSVYVEVHRQMYRADDLRVGRVEENSVAFAHREFLVRFVLLTLIINRRTARTSFVSNTPIVVILREVL